MGNNISNIDSAEVNINNIKLCIKKVKKERAIANIEDTITFSNNKQESLRDPMDEDNDLFRVGNISPHMSTNLLNLEECKSDKAVNYKNKAILYIGVSNDIYTNYRLKDQQFEQVVLILGSKHIFGRLDNNHYWVFDKIKDIPMFKLNKSGIIEITPYKNKNIKCVTVKYGIMSLSDNLYLKCKDRNIRSGSYIFTNKGII